MAGLGTLRGWDQRFAIVVDAALAVLLFIVCSGWFAFSKVAHVDLWFVAGLTPPLIFRRRAPVTVFMVIAVVALVQWATTGPLLADTALLVALYTVAAESDWIAVVVAALILEIGVILATERWTPVGNYSKSLIFLTGMATAALLAGVVVREMRTQMSWLAERVAATRNRARPADVSRRSRRTGADRPRDARRRLAQHPGHGDVGRRRHGGPAHRPGPSGRNHGRGVREPAVRHCATCVDSWASCVRARSRTSDDRGREPEDEVHSLPSRAWPSSGP